MEDDDTESVDCIVTFCVAVLCCVTYWVAVLCCVTVPVWEATSVLRLGFRHLNLERLPRWANVDRNRRAVLDTEAHSDPFSTWWCGVPLTGAAVPLFTGALQ